MRKLFSYLPSPEFSLLISGLYFVHSTAPKDALFIGMGFLGYAIVATYYKD